MTEPLVRIRGLGKSFGPTRVLEGVAPPPIFSYARFAEERAKLTGARRQHS